MKLAIDINIYISAFIFKGVAQEFFDRLNYTYQIYISSPIKSEIVSKFEGEKVKKLLAENYDLNQIDEYLKLWNKTWINIEPVIVVKICRDPKVNMILELADTAQAKFIITEDKDLLILNQTKIISLREFIDTKF